MTDEERNAAWAVIERRIDTIASADSHGQSRDDVRHRETFIIGGLAAAYGFDDGALVSRIVAAYQQTATRNTAGQIEADTRLSLAKGMARPIQLDPTRRYTAPAVAPPRLSAQDRAAREAADRAREADLQRKFDRLWQSRRPLAGSPAEVYLRQHRGVTGAIPPESYCSAKVWDTAPTRKGTAQYDALICAARRPDGSPARLQVILLNPDGSPARYTHDAEGNPYPKDEMPPKLPKRVRGRDGDDVPVTIPGRRRDFVIECEGNEDALLIAAATDGEFTVTPTFGASSLGKAPHPPGTTVLVFGDTDANGVGQRAAKVASASYAATGVSSVAVFAPQGYKDADDFQRSAGLSALGAHIFAAATTFDQRYGPMSDKMNATERAAREAEQMAARNTRSRESDLSLSDEIPERRSRERQPGEMPSKEELEDQIKAAEEDDAAHGVVRIISARESITRGWQERVEKERVNIAGSDDVMISELDTLAHSQSEDIRAAVTLNPKASPEALAHLATDPKFLLRGNVAMHTATSPETLLVLSQDKEGFVRGKAALNPSLPADRLSELQSDPNARVREAVAVALKRREDIMASTSRYTPPTYTAAGAPSHLDGKIAAQAAYYNTSPEAAAKTMDRLADAQTHHETVVDPARPTGPVEFHPSAALRHHYKEIGVNHKDCEAFAYSNTLIDKVKRPYVRMIKDGDGSVLIDRMDVDSPRYYTAIPPSADPANFVDSWVAKRLSESVDPQRLPSARAGWGLAEKISLHVRDLETGERTPTGIEADYISKPNKLADTEYSYLQAKVQDGETEQAFRLHDFGRFEWQDRAGNVTRQQSCQQSFDYGNARQEPPIVKAEKAASTCSNWDKPVAFAGPTM